MSSSLNLLSCEHSVTIITAHPAQRSTGDVLPQNKAQCHKMGTARASTPRIASAQGVGHLLKAEQSRD